MEEFYSLWRQRFAFHAALMLAISCLVGLVYHATLEWDDGLSCATAEARCDPVNKTIWTCIYDNPCIPETILEHRWRMAHQQGLQHALLLFGFAIGIAYFRIGRSFVAVAGWLLIIGCWATLIGASLQAATTFAGKPGWKLELLDLLRRAIHPTAGSYEGWEALVRGLFIVGGPAAGIALFLVAIRTVWEGVRDGIAPSTWVNWAKIVRARPRRIEEPTNLGELLRAVQTAIDHRMHVRAFGSRFSWSAIAPTDGTMIDMRHLRKIYEPVDPDAGDLMLAPDTTKTVWVQAGATIRELTKRLRAQKLMLKTTTVIPWVQVGGAVALGCHGTGAQYKPLSDLVIEMEIVQYANVGGVRTAVLNTYRRPLVAPYPGNQAEWDAWNALIVNLGCLGVMYRIRFECVALFNVHIIDTRMDMETTISDDARLRQILTGKEYAEIFWVPYNDECWVRSWDRIPDADGFGLWFWVRQWIVARLLGPAILAPLALFPYLTRRLMSFINSFLAEFNHRVPAPEAMQYQRFFMRVFDMGYAIPYSADPNSLIKFDQMRKAWFAVVDRLAALHHQAIYPQNLVLHARFGAASTAHLAPSVEQPSSCYIEIVTHGNKARHEQYFRDVERHWLRLRGRPHWGKVTYAPDQIRDAYPVATVAKFLAVRHKMDPDQVFLNDYLREVLRVEEP